MLNMSTIRDHQNFNVNFIAKVQQHRILYDSTMEEYTNRQVQEEIWNEIGKELNESGAACRERWKNIRSAFRRFLRQRSASKGHRKHYYLAKYLKFLVPYTQQRQKVQMNPTIVEDLSNNEPTVIVESNNEDNFQDQTFFKNERLLQINEEDTQNEDVESTSAQSIATKRKETDPLSGCNVRFIELKKTKADDSEDHDWQFLRSVLPDLKSMNNQQKAQFKLKTMQNICEILYG